MLFDFGSTSPGNQHSIQANYISESLEPLARTIHRIDQFMNEIAEKQQDNNMNKFKKIIIAISIFPTPSQAVNAPPFSIACKTLWIDTTTFAPKKLRIDWDGRNLSTTTTSADDQIDVQKYTPTSSKKIQNKHSYTFAFIINKNKSGTKQQSFDVTGFSGETKLDRIYTAIDQNGYVYSAAISQYSECIVK